MIRWAIVLMVMFGRSAVGAVVAAELPPVLGLVSSQSPAMVIIPSLKKASDDLTECLERMERTAFLVGSRPLDLVKSSTGFTAGVDDNGSLVLMLFPTDENLWLSLALVPVTDPAVFLTGNFMAGEKENQLINRAGSTLWGKPIGTSHVLLGDSEEPVAAYDPAGGSAAAVAAKLGERGLALFHAGEIIAYADETGLTHILNNLVEQAALRAGEAQAEAINAQATRARELVAQAESSLLVIDFDSLGIVGRSTIRWKPDTEAARLTVGGANRGVGLARLPGKPFYLAGAVDIAGIGGAATLTNLMQQFGVAALPEWMLNVDGFQFAAFPSPAGLQGGLLNDAVLLLETARPDLAKAFMREQLLAMNTPADEPAVEDQPRRQQTVTWVSNKDAKDAGTADAYEIKTIGPPAGGMAEAMFNSMMVGGAGWRGFAREVDGGLVVTFSQRPAVLKAGIEGATNGKGGMASDGVIRTMRMFLPAKPDVEMYIGLAQIAKLVGPMLNAAAMQSGVILPKLDENMEPIGIGGEVHNSAMEAAIVLPTGILRVIFDQTIEQLGRMGAGEELGGVIERSPEAPPAVETEEAPAESP